MRKCRRLQYALSRGPKLLWEIPSELIALGLARRKRIHDLDVLVLDENDNAADIFAKINDALAELRDVDPRRLARIKGDITRILVIDAPSSSYYSLSNSCVLSRARVLKGTATRVALTIVHEATHARLFRAGVDYRQAVRARVERRCTNEELSFLQRLKVKGYRGTDAWVAYLEERLSRPWWTDDALLQSKHDFLKHRSMPVWLLRMHALVFRPKDSPRNEE